MTEITRAIVLAAGRGERMRPLTDQVPKPLLPVHGKPLLVRHLEALAAAGVREVVVNTAWLSSAFPPVLGDGRAWGLTLHLQQEDRDWGQALETAGALATALPRLSPDGESPFWVVSGDIYCPGFDYRQAAREAQWEAHPEAQAHLWMVPNPAFHPRGDFALSHDGQLKPLAQSVPESPLEGSSEALSEAHGEAFTYANLALMRPSLLHSCVPGVRAPLGPVLQRAAAQGVLRGSLWQGAWENVGTPAQWQSLQSVAPDLQSS